MTQVFYSSTLFGSMTLAAALDAGCFGPRTDRRLLVVSNNAAVPETATPLQETAGFATVRDRFDEVVSWNDLIWPLHPSGWVPPAGEVPMLGRLLRSRLGLADGPRELVVESIAVAPARTLVTLLGDCPVTAYSDGLMSYGPTRSALPADVARVERLLYLDLVPGLRPLLLRERGVAGEPVPAEAFRQVIARLPVPPEAAAAAGCPVIVGQYLSALGLVTPAEEADLHGRMLRALAARGHRRVVFKPHPASGTGHTRALGEVAAACGVELVVVDHTVPSEVWFAAAQPELVVSCFSTALATARRHYGLAVATMGADLLLERIAPFQNSNRIPATVVAATVPELADDGTLHEPDAADIEQLVQAVSFCMQPDGQADLRDTARAYLAAHGTQRYFKRRRLEAVGLVAPRHPRARRVVQKSAFARRRVQQLRRVLDA